MTRGAFHVPTYELRCETCGHSFELFRTRLLRDEDRVCPMCGSIEISRGIGGGQVMGARGENQSVGSPTCGTGFR